MVKSKKYPSTASDKELAKALKNPHVIRGLMNILRKQGHEIDWNGHVWDSRNTSVCPYKCRFCGALSGSNEAVGPCSGDKDGVGPYALSIKD